MDNIVDITSTWHNSTGRLLHAQPAYNCDNLDREAQEHHHPRHGAPSPACAARSSRPRKGQQNIRLNISNVLSWGTASPTPSSRPTVRMPSRSSPNKLHSNLVFQQGRVQHMIIEAREQSRGSIKSCSLNSGQRGFNGHHIWDCNITTYLLLPYHGFFNTASSSSTFSSSGTTARHPSQPTMDTTTQLLFPTSGRLSMQTSSASTAGSRPSATNIKRSQVSG